MIRKIDAMHWEYGIMDGKKCRDCCNYYQHHYGRTYSKCRAYGESASEATDWSGRHTACKLFGTPFETLGVKPLVRNLRPARQRNEPVQGQMRFDDAYVDGGATNADKA